MGTISKGDLTIEGLLEEKKSFDIAVRFEKLGMKEGDDGWSQPGGLRAQDEQVHVLLIISAPSTGNEITGLPSASNILSTHLEMLSAKEG